MTRRHMRHILVALSSLLAAYEVVALLDPTQGDTISVSTRELFRTDTLVGRGVWTVFWVSFSCWYGWHIAHWHKEKATGTSQ